MNDHYDIILIGSGMGALTVASLMTQLQGIENKGGRFVLRREVTGIIIQNGRAVGIRARKTGAGNTAFQ
jgi:phytoene dehydrogenase-like protein